jgi:hypothetical protein
VTVAESAAPELAAVPFAVAVKVRVPTPEGVQEYVNWTVAPAATVEEEDEAAVQTAEAVPVPVVEGVTPTAVADAPPTAAVFWTLAMRVTTCPALTVDGGWAANATARTAAV